jgi:hypothetical protein
MIYEFTHRSRISNAETTEMNTIAINTNSLGHNEPRAKLIAAIPKIIVNGNPTINAMRKDRGPESVRAIIETAMQATDTIPLTVASTGLGRVGGGRCRT